MKKRNVTMQDIASRTGVSITTVSHVINKTRHVNSETRELVLKALFDLGYDFARRTNGPNRTSGLIGVNIADVREDYYVALIRAIENAASDNGMSIVFCDSEMNSDKEASNIATMLERGVSGLILAPIHSQRVPEPLRSVELPIVLVDRQYDDHNWPFVGINNFESGALAVRYLESKGSNRIGFIGHSDHVYSVRKRVSGYKYALLDSDASYEPSVLVISYDTEDSYALIREFITTGGFDGLICATSDVCYEAISAIDDIPLSVPNDIKILTYDDNKWLDYLKYPISVISQPTGEIGSYAVERIVHFLNNPTVDHKIKSEKLYDVSIIDRL